MVKNMSLIMQGKASSMVAIALAPKHGWEVIDAFAAPGNKTIHLAALMRGKGSVLACERDFTRFDRLKETVKLARAINVLCKFDDFLNVSPEDPSFSQVRAILLDPSCSESGTVGDKLDHLLPSYNKRVNSESKLIRVRKFGAFQKKALEHALSFPGVERIVYSTCSVNQVENEDVVKSVLPIAESFGFHLDSHYNRYSEKRTNLLFIAAVYCESATRMKILEVARIPLKGWQKTVIAVGSAVVKYNNPYRGDLIAALGETTGEPAFNMVFERMKKSTEGREVLANRPRIIASSVQHLYDLPPTTFGGAYAEFMRKRNFSADDRLPIRFCDSDELAYVMMRARDLHDIWHTLFNVDTNLVGETTLKLIEFEQMHIPLGFLYFIGGSIKFNEKQRKLFYSHYFPWAVKAGLQATDLMCVYYEKYYEEDIDVFRQRLGIIPAPPPPPPNQD